MLQGKAAKALELNVQGAGYLEDSILLERLRWAPTMGCAMYAVHAYPRAASLSSASADGAGPLSIPLTLGLNLMEWAGCPFTKQGPARRRVRQGLAARARAWGARQRSGAPAGGGPAKCSVARGGSTRGCRSTRTCRSARGANPHGCGRPRGRCAGSAASSDGAAAVRLGVGAWALSR